VIDGKSQPMTVPADLTFYRKLANEQQLTEWDYHNYQAA
jgi:hypothetical protein